MKKSNSVFQQSFPKNQQTLSSTQNLKDTYQFADNFIKQDYQVGPKEVTNKLNSLINNYEKPNIFNDSKRLKYVPSHYRESNPENNNRIINNNTYLRLFNRNNPIKNEFQPILDQNQAMVKPKHWMLTYEPDNVGILKRNKSQQIRDFYTKEKLEKAVPFQDFKEKFTDIAGYYQFKDHYASSLNHIRNPDSNVVSNRSLQPPYSTYKDQRVQQSMKTFVPEAMPGQRKEFQRMLENQKRSQLLAEEFLTKATNRREANLPIPKEQKHWNPEQFRQLELMDPTPPNIIDKNQYYQLENIYRTSKKNLTNKAQFVEDQRTKFVNPFFQSTKHAQSLTNMNPIDYQRAIDQRYLSYRGLGKIGLMEQFHPDLSNKPHFRDLMDFSRSLDREISSTMKTMKELHPVHLS